LSAGSQGSRGRVCRGRGNREDRDDQTTQNHQRPWTPGRGHLCGRTLAACGRGCDLAGSVRLTRGSRPRGGVGGTARSIPFVAAFAVPRAVGPKRPSTPKPLLASELRGHSRPAAAGTSRSARATVSEVPLAARPSAADLRTPGCSRTPALRRRDGR